MMAVVVAVPAILTVVAAVLYSAAEWLMDQVDALDQDWQDDLDD